MFPSSADELEKIRRECRKMVTKRAALSGTASIVPLPGLDMATDIGLLAQMLPEINERFGLHPEQMDEYNPQIRMIIANALIRFSTQAAGKWITKELIVQILKKVGVRITTKQAAKYIPFVGQAASAALGFTAMKILGNQHIEECYRVAKHSIEEVKKLPPPVAPPALPS